VCVCVRVCVCVCVRVNELPILCAASLVQVCIPTFPR